jgi:ectoine hydroxylase-related dioxygenase (phytanoyl-CoA dioxygenase family)
LNAEDIMEQLARFSSTPAALNLPWIDSPFFPDLLQGMTLDPEIARIIRDFAANGFVIIDPEIPQALLESISRDLRDRFTQTVEPYYADETRVQDAWMFNEDVRAVACAPRILEILRILYQREPVPFQTLNFRVGSQQRTHSDTIHFDSIPQGFMCGVWLALEDVDHSNGPLHYYPGSQKLPIYNLHDIGITGSAQAFQYERYSQYEDFVQALMIREQFERQELKVERGQALIWSANLFHGGSPIMDDSRTRLSQVTHYYFSGCLYYTPLLSDPAIGKMYVRTPVDLRTRQVVPQYYNGELIVNPGEWPPQFEGGPAPQRAARPPVPLPQRFYDWLTRPDSSVRFR